jgi:phosphoribosyl-AMP cyclohydrolase
MVRGFFIAHMNLNYSKLSGILPAVIQEASTGRVLMVGFMNEEAFRRTVETGTVTFFSRSKERLWIKGERSGHRLLVREIAIDCDEDSVLIQVEALGPGVCHRGYKSCFFRRLQNGECSEIETPVYDPKTIYGPTS